ncbi:hypothetical protein [Nitratidesulfovibrio sp. SRB-5]|uniref:hypothetical protein n=1 Tax=Nitratidesulfovibrio sp. SRB-5 TaxID=2872636 RepID=UPI001CBA66F5|nr:hypothetical protein [Nitratidesulfovibrio sp. SRB-5]
MHNASEHPVLYIPLLHRELAPACLPEGVAFLSAGLPGAPSVGGGAPQDAAAASAAAPWRSPLLPLSEAEARACLAELLDFGMNVGSGPHGDLAAMVAALESAQDEAPFSLGRSELAALENFSSGGTGGTGGTDGTGDGAASEDAAQADRNRRMAAQKTLILAWHLEERVRELDALKEKFSRSRESLADILGVETDEELREMPALDPYSAMLPGSGADIIGPSWRVIVENMGPFLPDGAVLFTCDAEISATLRDGGAAFAPVTAEQAASLCPAWGDKVAKLVVHARLPLWQVAGRPGPDAARPWLDRVFDVVCCGKCAR